MKKGIIVSASGRASFSKKQIKKIDSVLDAIFYARLTLMSKEEFIKLAKDAEILAVTRRSIKDIDREVIESLPRLQGVAIYSTGYEWVDVEYLNKKRITLSYLPDYATISVAEHTLGVILSMSRRIHLSFDRVRGIVSNETSLRGWELRNKTVGIVGLGRIGREVVRLLKAFGTTLCFYDNKELHSVDAYFLPFEKLLKAADIIVLTASKQRSSPPIITKSELALMKKGAYLINPSRAALVDNRAVMNAIREKKLGGYAVDDSIDIFTENLDIEPGRILQTGHTAWYSDEAIARGTDEWVDNIVALAIDKPQNVANKV